jgi:hypothetical protein
MARNSSRAFAIMGAIGAVLIAAAQTKPEDAQTNIAGWLRRLGIDRVPEPLSAAGADAWTTVAGLTLLVATAGLWGWARRRRRLADEAAEAAYRAWQDLPPETPPGRLLINWEHVHSVEQPKGPYKAVYLSPFATAHMVTLTPDPGTDPRVQYRCEVVNHGPIALMRVELLPTVFFATVQKEPQELRPEDIVHRHDLPISIATLGVGEAQKFEFYVILAGDNFAYLDFPEIAVGIRVDRKAPEVLTVAIAPKDQVMMLAPAVDHSATVKAAERAMRANQPKPRRPRTP